MALEVIKRPSKDMPDGFESRWNGSRTPLNYKFRNDLFPVNEFDNVGTITVIQYVSSKLGTQISCNQSSLSLGLSIGDYVEVNNTGTYLDGNFYKISEIVASNSFIIKAKFDGIINGLGTVQKYYKGYKALVNVYVGAPTYHPYYDDGSKPEYLASQIQVDFGSDNEGVANVRQLVKPDLNSKFDEDNTNSHYAWTSFFIEYAETWDNKTDPIVFESDPLDGCLPFTNFDDPSFNDTDNNWEFRPYSTLYNFNWETNVPGRISCGLPGRSYSDIVFQTKEIKTGSQYKITYDVSLFPGLSSTFLINVVDEFGNNYSGDLITSDKTGEISFNVGRDSNNIGVVVRNAENTGGLIRINSLNISVDGNANPCDYSSFALFGSKQFQDHIGGNFGDYVLRPFGQNEPPKILTNFESIEFFPNKKGTFFVPIYQEFSNYVCAIIPASTFSQSEGGDSVFLEIVQSQEVGQFNLNYRIKVDNKSDGVYVVDFKDFTSALLDSETANKESYCQFIIIPGNTLSDFNNGQFLNDISNWGVTTITNASDEVSGGDPNYADISPLLSGNAGNIVIGFDLNLKAGTYKTHETQSPIAVIEGNRYDITYQSAIGNGSPNMTDIDGNFLSYWLPQGYTESEMLSVSKQAYLFANSPLNPDGTGEPVFVESTISFVAKSDGDIVLERYIDVLNDLNNTSQGGGCNWLFTEMKFQGPIDYISEKKPINVNTDCFGYKGVELRWIDTLGNWEYWKFKQYQDVKEKFKKTEIKTDIFTDYDDYFINGQSQYKAISVDSRKSVTVRSGLLTEDQLKNVSALQRSIEIQYKTDLGKWQTCSIKSGSFTSLEEKNNIREISFDVELVDTLTPEL